MPQSKRSRLSGKQKVALPVRFEPKTLEQADGRYAMVKKLRKKIAEMITSTGADSVQKQILATRAAFIALRLESIESDAGETGEFDEGAYIQGVNCLKGLLNTLGMENAVTVADNLSLYIEKRRKA